MPESTSEPTSLVLEQFRLMRAETASLRAETNARFDEMSAEIGARFDKIGAAIADLKSEIRGFQRNTIAEIYKANLTVDKFVSLEGRVDALERRPS